jgi:putative endonuclease
MAYVYMLKCSDDSFYVGSTRTTLEARLAEHDAGAFDGYTATRRPVSLAWFQEFPVITDANAVERQIKGWSRAKKMALMNGDFDRIKQLAKRRSKRSPSFETQASPAPQDEVNVNSLPHPEEAAKRPSRRMSGENKQT